jgi:hypothetical protein
VHHRVLRLVGDELFHRPVSAVVKQDPVRRVLDLRLDVREAHAARRAVVLNRDPLAEHRLKFVERQVLLPVARRAHVDDVLGDQPVPRRRELQHLLEQRRVALVQ